MAERFDNEFVINRPVDAAWDTLIDLERIAPCLPGAALDEVIDGKYQGRVTVKLGAITARFKGEARIVERDDVARRAVVIATGRDMSGRGNAEARIEASVESLSDAASKCSVSTELAISGKVAQFGKGVMRDVSRKLLAEFATNLNSLLDESAPTTAVPDTAPQSDDGIRAPTESGTRAAARAPGGADAIDLVALAGPSVIKRLVVLALAGASLGLIAKLLCSRR